MTDIAHPLIELAQELRMAIDKLIADWRTPASFVPRREIRPTDRLELATSYVELRGRRNRLFGEDADLFGEPAWDIMLDLYVHHERKEISVSSACGAARVPATTALRWVRTLEDKGLVERSAKLNDRRVAHLALTRRGLDVMDAVLQDGLIRLGG